MKVREIMRRALVTIVPDASMQAAVEIMRTREVRHLLVTDEGELLGVLTDETFGTPRSCRCWRGTCRGMRDDSGLAACETS